MPAEESPDVGEGAAVLGFPAAKAQELILTGLDGQVVHRAPRHGGGEKPTANLRGPAPLRQGRGMRPPEQAMVTPTAGEARLLAAFARQWFACTPLPNAMRRPAEPGPWSTS